MLGNLLQIGMKWAEQQKPILVHPEKCTHTRHKASTCNACIEVCPNDSIDLKNGLSVDWSCNSCGLCTSVCPTEALEVREKNNKQFYTEVKKRSENKKRIYFHCDQAKEMAKADNQIIVPCTGMVDEVAIQLAIANGVKEFYFLTDICEQCTLSKGERLFQARLSQWKNKYRDVEWHEINRSTYLALLINEATKSGEYQDENQIDRREFLKVFGKEAKNTIVHTLVKEKETTPWKDGELTSQQSIRLQVYHQWIKPNVSMEYPIMNKQFSLNEDQCTLCGICEKVCPTNAIEINQENQQLQFQREQCIGCTLCQDVCFRNAITFLTPSL